MVKIDITHTELRPDGLRFDPLSGVLLAVAARIHAGPTNARRRFPQHELDELRGSIDFWRERGRGAARSGLLMPLLCRWEAGATDASGAVQPQARLILAEGERRWRVTKDDYDWLPLTLDNLSDEEARMVALATSIHKKLLSPVEEAAAFAEEIKAPGGSLHRCARSHSISEGYIRNRVGLLNCPLDVQVMVDEEPNTMSHGLLLGDPKAQLTKAERAPLIELVRGGLGVVSLKVEITRIKKQKEEFKQSQRAPDTETGQRARLHAQDAGGSVSRGRIVSGPGQAEAKAQVEAALSNMERALSEWERAELALAAWLPKTHPKYRKQVAEPHRARLAERATRAVAESGPQ